ncbi:MAG: Cu2+-exporting ATPase [Bacteroidetes bacterium]|nr:MAG: Cu2+-exporting ATPase [Bacteroidota bacterium]
MPVTSTAISCYHCGDECPGSPIRLEEKTFCCEGCKTVYQVLETGGLANYYRINAAPGASKKKKEQAAFAYLDDETVAQKLIRFHDGKIATVIFNLPQIHCSSCIYLLENLWKLHEGVSRVRVDFLKRTAHITFAPGKLSLRGLAELLDRIGYAPDLRLDSLEKKNERPDLKAYYYRLGIAFFCFGNIMLLSFPEYFGLDSMAEPAYRKLFSYLNFGLALPVMFYSALPFFRSAWAGVRERTVNMDVPIVLGILVMFVRSSWEIFAQTGPGFMDTLASLVFLMLVGRLFQQKTYHTLSFDRDYKSYFPVAATVITEKGAESKPVSAIRPGDRLLIRNGELIPADGLLFSGEANIDYSFVTGESAPVSKTLGELLYAGGRQTGAAIEMEVMRDVSQSYLTQLWNDSAFGKKEKERMASLATRISKWFTGVVILIAVISAFAWMNTDKTKAIDAFTSVLIITCPCALALSSPFTLGNLLRILGRNKIYLKSAGIIETLAAADTIVFDKTGTLTHAGAGRVCWNGPALGDDEKRRVRALTFQSAHPMSRKIFAFLPESSIPAVFLFKEITGKGIEGIVEQHAIRIGSLAFVRPGAAGIQEEQHTSAVYISIDGELKGYFGLHNVYREGLQPLVSRLSKRFRLFLLSGDNESEKKELSGFFPQTHDLHFHQSPADKLNFVRRLKELGHTTVMIGDGLNDAGALQESHAGITITDDINNFTPACDGIADASVFARFDRLFALARAGKKIILASFTISFLYNIAGLYFAVQGTLSPLAAAILMPVSSVTIILFTTLASGFAARRFGFR